MVQYLLDNYIPDLPWYVLAVLGLLVPPVAILVRWRSAEWMLLRAAVACGVTWLLYILTIDSYWHDRIHNLPWNATMAEVEAANADGAPRLFARLCGWIPVGFYVALWAGLWFIVRARVRSISPRRAFSGGGDLHG